VNVIDVADNGVESDEHEAVAVQMISTDDALARLLADHEAMLRATCRRALGREAHLVDDAMQETAILLNRHLPAISGSIPAWLQRTATGVCANLRRGEQRRRERDCIGAQMMRQTGHDHHHDLDAAIAALPEPERTVVSQHGMQGLDFATVAAGLGCTQVEARQAYRSGIAALRTWYARRGRATHGIAILALLVPPPRRGLARSARATVPWTALAAGLAGVLAVGGWCWLSLVPAPAPASGTAASHLRPLPQPPVAVERFLPEALAAYAVGRHAIDRTSIIGPARPLSAPRSTGLSRDATDPGGFIAGSRLGMIAWPIPTSATAHGFRIELRLRSISSGPAGRIDLHMDGLAKYTAERPDVPPERPAHPWQIDAAITRFSIDCLQVGWTAAGVPIWEQRSSKDGNVLRWAVTSGGPEMICLDVQDGSGMVEAITITDLGWTR
jgi:RNA polymerase sigma factor (sigma-70 family)